MKSLFCLQILLILISCQIEDRLENNIPLYKTEMEYTFESMESKLPNNISDSNHIALWRSGSIYLSDYHSCIVMKKSDFSKENIDVSYLIWEPQKPSNYSNWKDYSLYSLNLKDMLIDYKFQDTLSFDDISYGYGDSTAIMLKGEGLDANIFFFKEIGNDEIYPITGKFNYDWIKKVKFLFQQISKKEHIQTLTFDSDKIRYDSIGEILKSDIDNYKITYDGYLVNGVSKYDDEKFKQFFDPEEKVNQD